MNFFCRIFGHTWLHKTEDLKIRWTTAKNMNELDMTSAGTPKFYMECARCKVRRQYEDDAERRRAS